jgi:hypothetical protein
VTRRRAPKRTPHRDPRFNAFLVEKQQLEDLQTLIEIASGEHNAQTLLELIPRNLGLYRGILRGLSEEIPPGETTSEMGRYRLWLKDGFKKMFGAKGWRLAPGEKRFSGYAVTFYADRSPEYEDSTGVGAASFVAWRLTELHHWRIKRCAWPKCDKIFVAHKSSAYCSETHAQNMRTWRYRHGGSEPAAPQSEPRKAPRPARTLEAALKKQHLTRKDIMRNRRRFEEILEEPDNTWRADIEAARREKED